MKRVTVAKRVIARYSDPEPQAKGKNLDAQKAGKGYTLVEILVVVGLFSLLFSVVFEILSANRIAWDIGSTTQDLENQARLGLNNMTRELYTTNSGQITIAGTAPNQTITFKVFVGYDAGGSIQWGAEGFTGYSIKYTISNKQLLRQVLDGGGVVIPAKTKVFANSAQGLQFSLNSNLLTITLTTQMKSPGNRSLTRAITSSVAFRN